MAVSYGSEAGGSGNYEKMGIEFTYQYYTGVLSGGNPTGTLQSGLDSNTKSCKVTAHLWVWTKYRFEDSQVCTYSSGWVTASTWSGTISTPSNSSYSTSNKQNIRNCTKSYNLSASGTTPCSMTATMSGLYCSSSARPTKTLSVSLPAIPSAGYPTMGDGTYNFGNLTEMYSLSLANGNANCVVVSVSVDLKKGDGTTTSGIISTADRLTSCAVTTGSIAIGFTDAERTAILGYWENVSTGDATLPHDITPMVITVGFSISGGATSYFSMNITPPLIAALYNVSDPGLNVERANITGSVSSDQLATFTIAADADSPWYQIDLWPTTLLLAWLSIAGAAEVSMPRSATSTASISYYTYTDTTDLNLASTRAYAARLKSNGVQIPEAVDTTFTIQAIKSALKIYKNPDDANDKRVGINLDVDPAATLHVDGAGKFSLPLANLVDPTVPTLAGTWVLYTTNAPVKYWKDACGIVHLQGIVKSGTASSTIFTLPAGCRPGTTSTYEVACSYVASGTPTGGQVIVYGDGTVKHSTGPTTLICIDGFTFLAEQ
jgi:hypothetical protein